MSNPPTGRWGAMLAEPRWAPLAGALRCAGLLLIATLAGCDDAVLNLVVDHVDAGRVVRPDPDAAPAPSDASPPLDSSVAPRRTLECMGGRCACDNGIDDDLDGIIDGLDPECTGPYDDDERTFGTGLPGDEDALCRDCYFDGNTMGNDDDCNYDLACLRGEPSAALGELCDEGCGVKKRCVDKCQRRTPNGCDCFGCCEVALPGGGLVGVQLVQTCATDRLDDEVACPRCTPSPDCRNECGPCELCPGRTLADLPAACVGEGGLPAYQCDEGETLCDERNPCVGDFYCQLGCCLPAVL